MTIRDLILEKRRQVELLERHITMLEQMAQEDQSGGLVSSRLVKLRVKHKAPSRRRGGKSRAAMVEAYLQGHSTPQPARQIASALGLTPAEVHGAIHSGIKAGRFVRGKGRATFALGTGPARTRKASKTRKASRP